MVKPYWTDEQTLQSRLKLFQIPDCGGRRPIRMAAIVGLCAIPIAVMALPAAAQNMPVLEQMPPVVVPDMNGVDLRTGKIADFSFKVSLGDPKSPAIESVFQRRAGSGAPIGSLFLGKVAGVQCLDLSMASWCNNYRRVEFSGYSEWFVSSGGVFSGPHGETYSVVGGLHVVTLGDGTKLRFDPTKSPPQTAFQGLGSEYDIGMLVDATKPDGEMVTTSGWNYTAWTSAQGPNSARPSYNGNSLGYAVKYNQTTPYVTKFINLPQVYCSGTGACDANISLMKSVSGSYTSVTDPNGALAKRNCIATTSTDIVCTAIDRTGRSYEWTERRFDYYYLGNPQNLMSYLAVSSVNRAGHTTNYTYTFDWNYSLGARILSSTATYPNGDTRTVRMPTSSLEMFVRDGTGPETQVKMRGSTGRPDSAASASSDYLYIIYPEGNRIDYEYDARGNVTAIKMTPKPGSGLAVSQRTAAYPQTCASLITCNKPSWIRDAKGNLAANINTTAYRTDYIYSSDHGGVLTETSPPDSDGVRPQTRYTYIQLYAKVMNSAGTLVNSTPIWRLTRSSTCRTATAVNPASCVGTDQETVTEYEYANNNLLLTKTTIRAGNANVLQPYSVSNVWQTTTQSYDATGNLVAFDGPRTDVDDIGYTTYDVLRRPVFEIGADPDGASTLKRTVVRHLYDAEGREYLTERGNGSTITFSNGIPVGVSDFARTSYTETQFEAGTGLPVKTIVWQP